MSKPLGRRVPTDFKHVEKYPLRALSLATPKVVEKTLTLPVWHKTHDQGTEGSCVGHGTVMERAITNTSQNKLMRVLRPTVRYDPISLWQDAKDIDEYSDTHSGDDSGTSVRAAYDILRTEGARRCVSMHISTVNGMPYPVSLKPYDIANGVTTNRWATSVDEMRLAIDAGVPVTIGINWYTGFDTPEQVGRDWWIARSRLGSVRGGHCVCVYGASDKKSAFKLKNSWGLSYPEVWIPYSVMVEMLEEDGEAAVAVDR